MINSSELRIGNWISTPRSDRKVVEIVVKNNDYAATFDGLREGYYLENCEPIELTGEWLLKFGFSDKDYKPGYIGIDVCHTDFVLEKPNEEHDEYAFMFDYGGWPRIKRFNFVHELQNFFYSLYREDLKINS